MSEPPVAWHHRPAHVFEPNCAYIVTASTLHKRHYFLGESRLRMLTNALFEVAAVHGWSLEAWAVFSNHYHFVASSPRGADTLRLLVQQLHSRTALELNRLDKTPGRQVWFQYWDTCLTYPKSYYARLKYVHNNPVKHGLATAAEKYPFCSAGWFGAQADPRFRKKVESFRCDRLRVPDDF